MSLRLLNHYYTNEETKIQFMSKGKNWSLTKNNPAETLEAFFEELKEGALYARVQQEMGENGTPHFQACVGYTRELRFSRMKKNFPDCHIALSRNAMKAWNYCAKEDSRIAGPLSHGVPPASRRIKGDTKARNKMLIDKGVVKAVDEGLIPLEKFKQVKQSLDLYHVMKTQHRTLDALDNEWHYGPTGTGKSRSVRLRYPGAFIKGNNIWWDGYDG